MYKDKIVGNRIDNKLASLKADSSIALVPYLTVGYPDVSSFYEIANSVLGSGADMLELGIPFSDPLADGPTIQMTSFKALENGVNMNTAFDIAQKIRTENPETPLIFMGYFNPFLTYGISEFMDKADSVGIDGIIIPDLPSEEAEDIARLCKGKGIHLIPLLAPTSTEERIEAACSIAGGFIYCVSLTGVTGANSRMSQNIEGLINNIRKQTNLPILVGFGISSKKDIEQIAGFADGAIVGSALLDVISKANKGREIAEAIKFIEELK